MDLLVKLYDHEADTALLATLAQDGVSIRRALTPELSTVARMVTEVFGERWGSEATVAFSRQPPSCFLAVKDKRLVGFACYDTTARAFFGPTGVLPEARGKGIGRALLLACLTDMRSVGYAYAIIGWAGPVDFYVRTVGAIPIPDSEPGIYAGLLPATPRK